MRTSASDPFAATRATTRASHKSMLRSVLSLALATGASAFVQPALRATSKLATSKVAPAQMMLEPSVMPTTNLLAGVVAVDGGTIGLEVSFAAFLAVILGLFIPVVFLVTLYIQSEAQGTATSFRNPDSSGGQRFDA